MPCHFRYLPAAFPPPSAALRDPPWMNVNESDGPTCRKIRAFSTILRGLIRPSSHVGDARLASKYQEKLLRIYFVDKIDVRYKYCL